MLIVGGLLLAMLAAYVLWRRHHIHSNGIYVLAKVTRVKDDGPTYYFYYHYNKVRYEAHVTGFFTLYDSLMMVKVAKLKPDLWLYTHLKVPACIRHIEYIDSFWDRLPSCKNGYYSTTIP